MANRNLVQSHIDELKIGDRVQVEYRPTAGQRSRAPERSKICGIVVRIDRHRQGLPPERCPDDEQDGDAILLEQPDGELVTIAVDEATVIRRA